MRSREESARATEVAKNNAQATNNLLTLLCAKQRQAGLLPVKEGRLHNRLVNFGNELYYRRCDLINNAYQTFKNKALLFKGKIDDDSRIAYDIFKNTYDDFNFFPPFNLLIRIANDDDLQTLIEQAYNSSKKILEDFGKELFYRQSINNYTLDNFKTDISIFASCDPDNISDGWYCEYMNFKSKFSDFSFFPDCQLLLLISRNSFLQNDISTGYIYASKNPSERRNFFKSNKKK